MQQAQEIIFFLRTHPFLLVSLLAWALTWKGIALWKAAGRRDMVWFVILLVVNTLSILEIIYVLFVDKGPEETYTEEEKLLIVTRDEK